MDAAALAALLSTSTDKLVGLHAQIGHPPEALQGALDALHQALKAAVDDQIGKVQHEAEDLRQQCANIESENVLIKIALGEKGTTSPPSLQNAIGQRMISAASSPKQATTSTSVTAIAKDGPPLLQRRAQLEADQVRLKASYSHREAQLDRLVVKLQSYVPLLGGFVQIPENKPAGATTYKDVSQPRIASIEAEIIRCSKEVNTRSEKLQTSLLEIIQLWSELNLEPCQPAARGDEQVFMDNGQGDDVDCGGSTLAFDRAILAHLQLQPIHDDKGKFVGEFITTEAVASGSSAASEAETRAIDILSSTPTRASMGGLPAKSSGDLVLQLPSSSKSAAAAPSPSTPSYLLEPSETNLARTAKKLEWLESEKLRREMLIQDLYDELSELWAKFDVPEEEMDAFVMDHRGSTLEVLDAYQAELEKMKQLKAQHMSLFILKTRERIATLWDSLFLTQEEREASFPPFFIDVSSEANPNHDEPLPTDEILASHEQMIDYLTEQVRTKAPVLKVIGRYKELLDEQRQLDESAADGSRLLGRSNRGDPGRLLREEKMRKRVKIQKPKIEAELMKAIPAWEEEHGESFTINGVRYLDELMEQIEGSKENATRKRTRTVSGASSAAPVVNAPGSVRRGAPLAPSAVSNRGVSSATPMRPVTPHQNTIKKPRLAPPPSSVSSTRTPGLRTGVGAPATVSRAASVRAPATTTSARAGYGATAASSSRPGTSMGSYRSASSSSHAGSSSPSRIPGPSPYLVSQPFVAPLPPKMAAGVSGYGSRNVTATSASVSTAIRTVKAQRESFRPRPSLVAKVSKNSTIVGGRAPRVSPGRASKWGEMGPPRWPGSTTAAAGELGGHVPHHHQRDVSSVSATSSIHTDITTVIHPNAHAAAAAVATLAEPAKRTRRAPSMSLEACLANLAASSSNGKGRIGDAGRDKGICSIRSVASSDELVHEAAIAEDDENYSSRVRGWKDGLRIAGAGLEEEEVPMIDAEQEPSTLPRSGSSNWELVEETNQYQSTGSALAA